MLSDARPEWLRHAAQYIGVREVKGPGVNQAIKNLWLSLKGGALYWRAYGEDDSKLPWCGAYAARLLAHAGVAYPTQYARALAWAEWGEACEPLLGAVVVFKRDGGGHVGFVVGTSVDAAQVLVHGGNQNDGVSEAWFSTKHMVACRKPKGSTLYPALRYHRPAGPFGVQMT